MKSSLMFAVMLGITCGLPIGAGAAPITYGCLLGYRARNLHNRFAILSPKKIAVSRRSFLAALIASILPGLAIAGPFVYTNIADSSGQFASFGVPAINNAGNAAFKAGLDAGPVGFFVGGGGPITPIITFTE